MKFELVKTIRNPKSFAEFRFGPSIALDENLLIVGAPNIGLGSANNESRGMLLVSKDDGLSFQELDGEADTFPDPNHDKQARQLGYQVELVNGQIFAQEHLYRKSGGNPYGFRTRVYAGESLAHVATLPRTQQTQQAHSQNFFPGYRSPKKIGNFVGLIKYGSMGSKVDILPTIQDGENYLKSFASLATNPHDFSASESGDFLSIDEPDGTRVYDITNLEAGVIKLICFFPDPSSNYPAISNGSILSTSIQTGSNQVVLIDARKDSPTCGEALARLFPAENFDEFKMRWGDEPVFFGSKLLFNYRGGKPYNFQHIIVVESDPKDKFFGQEIARISHSDIPGASLALGAGSSSIQFYGGHMYVADNGAFDQEGAIFKFKIST
ncbi:hypothetical protein [uncultured Tateyamaria sp.]|uniref:hypothetical protein n=1 Tax=uncultured Tateyamaria sp. TaxID=455651 RepID=UPI0026098496|nr:hypothetical protein [uncultured Tateyamaria sp.]